jgi:hypothetical protein
MTLATTWDTSCQSLAPLGTRLVASGETEQPRQGRGLVEDQFARRALEYGARTLEPVLSTSSDRPTKAVFREKCRMTLGELTQGKQFCSWRNSVHGRESMCLMEYTLRPMAPTRTDKMLTAISDCDRAVPAWPSIPVRERAVACFREFRVEPQTREKVLAGGSTDSANRAADPHPAGASTPDRVIAERRRGVSRGAPDTCSSEGPRNS